jgi:glycosyltransferase involved in cell wall biosynthesis
MKDPVVFCNHFARPEWLDGAEVSLLQIIKALPADRFERYLISPSDGQLLNLAERSGIQTRILPLSLMWTMGGLVDLVTTGHQSLQQHLESLLRKDSHEIFRLKRLLREIHPKTMLVNTSVNVIPAVIGKRLGIRVIWFIREYFRGQLPATGLILNQFADEIWVASTAMEKLLQSTLHLQKPVVKIPNFINTSNLEEPKWPEYRIEIRKKLGIASHQIAIGYWGSISPQKGIADFLEMAQILNQKYPGRLKFCIAGCAIKDAYLQSALAMTQRLNLQPVVVFSGFFPDSQRFLPGMDLMVVPSHFNETFSRSALEALVYSKPVVAYAGGGIGDIVQHEQNGFLVPKGAIDKLVSYCSRLVDNPALRHTLGANGRKWVDAHFTLSSVAPFLLRAFL